MQPEWNYADKLNEVIALFVAEADAVPMTGDLDLEAQKELRKACLEDAFEVWQCIGTIENGFNHGGVHDDATIENFLKEWREERNAPASQS